MTKSLLLLIGLSICQLSFSQTIVYQNQFEVASDWTLNSPTGVNGTDPNQWVISDDEGGVVVPGCGVATNGNKTLHISCAGGFCIGTGAIYNTGDAGLGFFDTETHVRTALAANIDLTGQSNLTLSFDYIANGDPGLDFGKVEYSIDGGVSWITLSIVNPTIVCGSGQGQWTLFTQALPVTVNNINNFRVAFSWENDNDAVGTDPSIAINNLRITTPSAALPPVAVYTVLPNPVCVGATVSTTNTSTNTPTSYQWGVSPATFTVTSGSLTSATPTFTFSAAGTYAITLVATNAFGSSPMITQTVTVNACLVPVAVFTATPGFVCTGTTVSTTNTSTNTPTSYQWGVSPATFTVTSGSLTSATPTFTFSVAGTYAITLVATNASGSSAMVTQTVTVDPCLPPTVVYTASDLTPCLNVSVTLTDNSLNTPTSWSWTVSPIAGATITGASSQNASILFTVAGTYMVTLTATNAYGSSNSVQTFTAAAACPGPVAAFTASTLAGCIGNPITLTDASTGAPTSWNWTVSPITGWNFTTGTAASQNPALTFTASGTYTVTLDATNASGTTSTSQTIVIADCAPPVPSFTPSSSVLCTGDCITFNNTSTSSTPATYSWIFGNSQTSTLQTPPSICYTAVGTYTVILVVTNAFGSTTATSTINVSSCGAPQAIFTVDSTLCEGDCINLLDASTGSPTSWSWNIPGTSLLTSTSQNPGLVCFTTPGTYVVSLTATNAFGSTTQNITIVVDPQSSVIITNPDTTIVIGTTIQLNAIGSGNGAYNWITYVNSIYPTASTVTIVPLESTLYVVYYTSPGGCLSSDSVNITVLVPLAVGVPSAFSPNGDGNNDVLYVKGESIKSIDFRVYNRLGQLVFESSDKLVGWDGSFNNKPENPGGFVYTLTYELYDSTKGKLKGSVSLVK